jgi:hypothetical protein
LGQCIGARRERGARGYHVIDQQHAFAVNVPRAATRKRPYEIDETFACSEALLRGPFRTLQRLDDCLVRRGGGHLMGEE